MRKRILISTPASLGQGEARWLPLERIASVEVSSEESAHPIENALLPHAETGWLASSAGEQIIRISFDTPQPIRHIHLVFFEHDVERSQEFVLSWIPNGGQTWHEIVRQQWNFSPSGSTQEIEDYRVELSNVTQIELKIIPDRSGGEVHASLAQFRLA